MVDYKHGRPTVGVLTGWQMYEGMLPHGYQVSVFRGIYDAACERKCNLLLACGMGERTIGIGDIHPAWPVISQDSDFIPVGPWNTDGLIVMLPLVSEARSAYVQQLRMEGHPVVFVSTGEDGPAVVIDNEGGIRQGLTHLKDHGHRRIAFVAGDVTDHGDGAGRFRAYQSAARELGLEVDARLIAYGHHNPYGSRQAMQEILSSGVQFSAVLASNDESAFGAMQVLKEAGRRIPQDVAVIGFDDRPEAAAIAPSLTTVHYPMFESGYQALELLLDYITGRLKDTRIVQIPTRLVIRQSCGCWPGVFSSLGQRSPDAAKQGDLGVRSMTPTASEPSLIKAMVKVVFAEDGQMSENDIRHLCQQLVEALRASLDCGDVAPFHLKLADVLRQVEAVDDDPHGWQAAISALRRELPVLLNKSHRLQFQRQAEDFLDQARIAISESEQQRYSRYQIQQNETAERVGLLTARLLSALDETQILRILVEDLSGVGIQHARVAFFEADGDDPVAWSNVRSGGGSEVTVRRFPSREFPPADFYPAEQPFRLALLPLAFQNEGLGFVAFEASNLAPCAAISRQLASAFKSAQLHAQVLELSLTDSLTGLHNLRYIELILRTEVERSRRYGRNLAMIMSDLDCLKAYNDALGHPAGSEALQRVAECLMVKARRGLDMVGRYGGDEFVVILPETDTSGALIVAENMRAAVEQLQLPRPLTMSFGVASMKGNKVDGKKLIQKADQALYKAKQTGSNRVCAYGRSERK